MRQIQALKNVRSIDMARKTSVNLRQFVTRQKVTLFVTALFMASFLAGVSLGMDVAFSLVP